MQKFRLRSVKGQTDRRYVKQMYDVAQRYASDALSFVPPSGFDVELLIDVETIISRVEIIGQERRCQSVCPTLPLYPPVPMLRQEKRTFEWNETDKKSKKT